MIDNDFLNDTIENLLQADLYKNIDVMTGVTLNEGLYFAEYHIGHFYNDDSKQTVSIGRRPASREKRSMSTSNHTALIAPDIVLTERQEDFSTVDENDKKGKSIGQKQPEEKSNIDFSFPYDPNAVLQQFARVDYVKRFLNANFQHGNCFINEVRERYAGKSSNF